MSGFFESQPALLKLNTEKKEFPECTFYYIDGELGRTQGNLIGKLDIPKNSFYIHDIKCTREDSGLGSMLLNEAIKIAKENHAKTVEGYLAEVDEDHIDKLRHFYTKFGFKITPSIEQGHLADIQLNLE